MKQIKLIPLNQEGSVAVINQEDYHKVKDYKWHLNDSGYAVWRGVKDGVKKTIRMHRLIAETPDNLVTDHLNHDKLDNRRENLRACTQRENLLNLTDQGKGYWYQRQTNRWVVEIGGKHRGCFGTEEEARDFAALVRAGVIDRKPKEIRTHCKYGHDLTNSYDYGSGKLCKKCQSIRSKRYYERKTKHSMDGNNDSKTWKSRSS